MAAGDLTAEPNPMDLVTRYRAQSILQGAYADRDGRSYGFDALTLEQAIDVIEWHQRNPA